LGLTIKRKRDLQLMSLWLYIYMYIYIYIASTARNEFGGHTELGIGRGTITGSKFLVMSPRRGSTPRHTD
jgi:hypothetical protein